MHEKQIIYFVSLIWIQNNSDINKIKNRQTSPDENEHVHEKNHKFTKNCLVKCIKIKKK